MSGRFVCANRPWKARLSARSTKAGSSSDFKRLPSYSARAAPPPTTRPTPPARIGPSRRPPARRGRGRTVWVVPVGLAFASAWLAVSVARELLRGRWFLAFWALYGLAWIAVAWHGAHFPRPPRPAALLMNLEEILETPLPAWSEMPWAALAGFLGLGWLAHKLSPPRAA